MTSLKRFRRIVITSNSQGTCVGVTPEQTYTGVLRRLLGDEHEVHSLLFSGWSIDDMVGALPDNILPIHPDLVIVNTGIIEAAQRILSAREKRWLACLPMGQKVGGLLHRWRCEVLRARHSLKIVTRVMPPQRFALQIHSFAESVRRAGAEVLFLEIPAFPDAGKALRHPFINQDVALYNQAFDGLPLARIEGMAWNPGSYQSGTVHFSPSGHETVASTLLSAMKALSHQKSIEIGPPGEMHK